MPGASVFRRQLTNEIDREKVDVGLLVMVIYWLSFE